MIKDCAFISSRGDHANGACISILGKYKYQCSKYSVVLQNVSSLYNEAFPTLSVMCLAHVLNVLLIDCYFGNKGMALRVESSVFHVQRNLQFINNTAFHKGALTFVGDSYMVLNNNTYIFFQNNSATHLGGAIYVGKLSCLNSLFHFSEAESLRYQNITINFINM